MLCFSYKYLANVEFSLFFGCYLGGGEENPMPLIEVSDLFIGLWGPGESHEALASGLFMFYPPKVSILNFIYYFK